MQRGAEDLSRGRGWSPLSPAELLACLRLRLNLSPSQASRHITLGFYYSPAPEHTESHVKAGHRPLRLAVPFLSVQHLARLMPSVSTHLPNHSLYSLSAIFSTHSHPFYGATLHSPATCSTPTSAPVILRAGGGWGDVGLRLMAERNVARWDQSEDGAERCLLLRADRWRRAVLGVKGECHCIKSHRMFDIPVHLLHDWSAVSSLARGWDIYSSDGSWGWG